MKSTTLQPRVSPVAARSEAIAEQRTSQQSSLKLSHEEMIRAHAEYYHLLDPESFTSKKKYVLHLIHSLPYIKASQLAVNKAVLDFGCNTGFGTAMLAETGESVVGVDVSDKAIATAQTTYSHLPIEFVTIDGMSVPFEDHQFEMIATFQVIEHVVDYSLYISELKRVLRPYGVALFTTPNAILRLDPGMAPWNKFHVKEFNYFELKALLKQFFSCVSVLGLFAAQPLYEIEFTRIARARAVARRSTAFASPRRWERAQTKPDSAASVDLSDFVNRYGTKDVFYSVEDLGVALDLLAVCSDDENVVRDAMARIVEV